MKYNLKFSSLVILATFQEFTSYRQVVTAVPDSSAIEHFHRLRKFFRTLLRLKMEFKCVWGGISVNTSTF